MDQSILIKRVRISDYIITALIYAAASLSILLLAGIVCYTFVKGVSSISWQFLTTVPSTIKGTFGIAGNLLNTLYCYYYPADRHACWRRIRDLSE